ncbi:hypothetical protein [Sphingomonas oligoaromativorans]|uniref:hypothetical protein n=1 Tax=Sphingomonas oligoaromativorans TaxID=575322 RepID=UPI00142087AE|nr:hypothetical protein [Sphingomonas oligoaromativorans]NIJ34311.1 hypothetical protein [Sphingomonas oligoaromativorans]
MSALPVLTAVEKRMLRNVRWGSIALRYDHPTMNALQTQQLVSSEIIQKRTGGLSVNRLWSITERGITAYGEQC